MKTRNKRLLSLLLSAEIVASTFIVAIPASADASAVGTPYDANGVYDVSVPHVVINQYYGSGTSTGGAVDYGFIELYNPTESAVDLSTWSIQYADRGGNATGASGPWQKLDLSGTIPAHGYYLIRGEASPTTAADIKLYLPDEADKEFASALQNKGMKVVLMSNQTTLDVANPFAQSTKPAGYVDMLGTGSNDKTTDIDGYENEYPAGPTVGSDTAGTTGGTSKNISLRRVNYADSDNNKNDFVQITYSKLASSDLPTYSPRNSEGIAGTATPPPAGPGNPEPVDLVLTGYLPDATASRPYSAKFDASGGTGPYVYSATGLPSGLNIDPSTGLITGTAAAASLNDVTVTVADSATPPNSVSKSVNFAVNPVYQDKISMKKLGSFIAGTPNEDGGVAEIVKYNPENHKFYSVNGSSAPATLDIVSLDDEGKPVQDTVKKINIEDALAEANIPDFAYGDFTSVDIDTQHDLVYAAIQERTYSNNGVILVFDYDGNYKSYYQAGVQPDMVKVTKDGRYVLTADEGEDRHAGIDPEGSVTIVDTQSGEVKHVKFDNPEVIADNVHLRGTVDEDGVITGPAASKEAAIYDLEPEYIALSADESKAYVSLQEGNAIGTIDIANKTVESVKGLGYKDLSKPENSLDLVKDGLIRFENVPFQGMFMPDGIDSYTVGGKTYLFTANEGDGTEWPDAEEPGDENWPGRTNVTTIGDVKGNLNPDSEAAIFLANRTVNGKTPYDKVEVPSDMGPDGIYLYGGRSFSVWDADTMAPVYDSQNDFEKITAQRLPQYFNSDHKEIGFDARSQKKGPEPEYVKVGQVGSKTFAFVGLERISGIMTYDVTDPTHPAFVNYVNTRNFGTPEDPSNPLQTDAGPEGIDFIPAADSPTGLPLILVANEVGGTISVMEMGFTKVTLDQTALSFQTGDNAKKLTATVTPAADGAATVAWSSSNTAVATVDANGNVTPVGAGTAVITALSADGYGMAEAAITVTTPSGSGGGGGPIINNPDNSDTPTVDGSKVTTEVKSATDASGNATAAITGEQVDQALSKLSAGSVNRIAFKTVVDANAKHATITLPAAAVDKLAGSAAESVIIDAGLGQVSFDRKALAAIANAATTGDVSVTVAKADPAKAGEGLSAQAQAALKEAIGTHPAYDFTVTADGKKVSDFAGGLASISIPYTPAAGENPNAIIAYYIADNGELVLVPQANYDAATGTLNFKVKHFSRYAVAYNAVNFGDIAASFAKDHITYLSAREIIKGTSATSFNPKANVTRADFTLILARTAGVDLSTYSGSQFSDVSADAYYAQSVAWAASTGITNGVTAGQFSPNANITREQMVAMIARFADKLSFKLPATAPSLPFADASSISAFAQDAAAAVQQAGIINGKPSGSQTAFAPKDFASREETAKMIAVLFQLMAK
ncbi:choice-of-anchor I family protein [Paenibacillus glycinis]|uniref:choice-of-anchor I family protein n=1 Tax=Paenibacillus glycinis TaxID=2697035 RepID=UPI001F330AD7|nr:choice-of-anchor I family protein [Paenibacillus glycinis]